LPRRKHNYTPEFREEAVKAVIETSRPIAQVAKELGIVEGTLGNWVNGYRREHAGDEPPLTISERARGSLFFRSSLRPRDITTSSTSSRGTSRVSVPMPMASVRKYDAPLSQLSASSIAPI